MNSIDESEHVSPRQSTLHVCAGLCFVWLGGAGHVPASKATLLKPSQNNNSESTSAARHLFRRKEARLQALNPLNHRARFELSSGGITLGLSQFELRLLSSKQAEALLLTPESLNSPLLSKGQALVTWSGRVRFPILWQPAAPGTSWGIWVPPRGDHDLESCPFERVLLARPRQGTLTSWPNPPDMTIATSRFGTISQVRNHK